jgi:hypothetical protein
MCVILPGGGESLLVVLILIPPGIAFLSGCFAVQDEYIKLLILEILGLLWVMCRVFIWLEREMCCLIIRF